MIPLSMYSKTVYGSWSPLRVMYAPVELLQLSGIPRTDPL